MADVREMTRQLQALAAELDRAVDEALAAGGAEVRERLEEVEAELGRVRIEKDVALTARQEAGRELEVAERRIESLVQKLKEARQAAVEAGEEAQRTLRRQMEALQGECDEARAELEKERSVRKRLEKGAAADEKRLVEMEKTLAARKETARAGADPVELDRLKTLLAEARAETDRERQSRAMAEAGLAEAMQEVAGLELSLKKAGAAAPVVGDSGPDGPAQIATLKEKLRQVEVELAAEQELRSRYARDCAGAQRRIDELESAAPRAAAATPSGDGAPVGAKAVAEKLLPHELRPAPKPGVLFRPDWDLRSLPCPSAEQILQAWASVSNVQLSLEGYPSQYCSAYLAVIKQGKQKQLYMLFNLKGIKHVLVCVPTAPPKDEASLARLIEEGRKYLLMSGFDLEKLPAADIPKRLTHYLQG